MFTVAIVVHIVVSVVLVLSVLLHSGKGASLGSSFGGSTSSQALFGSAGPAGLFTKVTAVCAAIFMVTSLYITYVSAHKDSSSIMQDVPALIEGPADEVPKSEEPVVIPEEPATGASAVTEEKAAKNGNNETLTGGAQESAGSPATKEAPKK